MTQEQFEQLSKTRKELIDFLEFTQDKDFHGICAHTYMLAYNIYKEITDKEIVDKIIALVKNELDELNKRIEEL